MQMPFKSYIDCITSKPIKCRRGSTTQNRSFRSLGVVFGTGLGARYPARSTDVIADIEGWSAWFARNPYAEWYMNSMRVPNGATAAYRAASITATNRTPVLPPTSMPAPHGGDPTAWAELLCQCRCQIPWYSPPNTTMDFCMSQDGNPNPFIPDYQVTRDLVGDLSDAVRARV
jgi:alpha-L-fucosidase